MQFSTIALAAFLGLASAQKVHVISVGSTNGDKIFSPDSVNANVGDMLQFQFRASNHSVVQSDFDHPCTPIAQNVPGTKGVFSGYMPVDASSSTGQIPVYTTKVMDTKPMWFYCSQATHCMGGMVMAVNVDTKSNATRSLANFVSLAKAAPANVDPLGTSNAATGSTGGSTTGSGSTGSGSDSTTTPGTGAGSMVAVSGSMGLLSVAAALLML
ncbi:Cupredoxin [Xylariomycetidae sp. FL0641]|nr:Cupredoxin [Xylariomycetidae sp. FL0641]